MAVKTQILFVDDQPNILAGLKRMLHEMRNEWDMEFCSSGKEALVAMERHSFDLVVADMMMPEMNGAQLLKIIRELYPGTVCFILSGHSDRELILQSVGFAHQYIAKPCDGNKLKYYLSKAMGLRQILSSREIHAKIVKVKTLPSPTDIYNKIVLELQSETTSINTIARLISRDISLTAKLLQVVNSAFFGLPTRVDNINQAVSYLGLNTIQGLVLNAGIYSQMKDTGIPDSSLELLFNHSMAVSAHARKIAGEIGLKQRDSEDAFLAGLLHDVGKLVMLTDFKDEMNAALELAQKKSIEAHLAEREILGVSHAEIGAHLLSLWGLHDDILEAIAFHHIPSQAVPLTRNILTTVYLANTMERCSKEGSNASSYYLDCEYLKKLELTYQFPYLLERCNITELKKG